RPGCPEPECRCSSRSSTTSRSSSEADAMTRHLTPLAAACCLAVDSLGVATLTAQATNPQSVVDAAYAKYKNLQEGKNAVYIPALAKVDPNLFGIALITVDVKVYTAGDVKTEVSIQ